MYEPKEEQKIEVENTNKKELENENGMLEDKKEIEEVQINQENKDKEKNEI